MCKTIELCALRYAFLFCGGLDAGQARFYRVELLPDIFGTVILERAWGRIGSRGKRFMVSYSSISSAELEASWLVHTKLRRGYPTIT